MYTLRDQEYIRILVADDDEKVLDCYREVFTHDDQTGQMQALNELAADLFDTETDIVDQPMFDIVACNQGDDAIKVAEAAQEKGEPFDVVILDKNSHPTLFNSNGMQIILCYSIMCSCRHNLPHLGGATIATIVLP